MNIGIGGSFLLLDVKKKSEDEDHGTRIKT
jgi:hypothetical protein